LNSFEQKELHNRPHNNPKPENNSPTSKPGSKNLRNLYGRLRHKIISKASNSRENHQ
ncbi:2020_t:CDS:1, partial [Acaulospora morrowiae]